MNPMLIALTLACLTLGPASLRASREAAPGAPAPQEQTPDRGQDPKAEELYQKCMKRFDEAKILHVQCTCTPEGARAADAIEFDAKVLGRACLWFSAKSSRRGMEFELRGDGRKLVASGRGERKTVDLAPEAVNGLVRRSAGQSMVGLILMMEMGRHRGGDRDVPAIPDISVGEIKIDGTEKIGAVEATILTYKIKPGIPDIPEFAVKSWIDPATSLPVKRTLAIQGMSILEDFKVLSFDEKMTEEDFAFHNAKTLAKGREVQVLRSVELFAKVTGRAPRSLEELKRRPAALASDVFWPDGGFWLGDAPPKDVPYSVSGETAKVGESEVKAPDGRFLVAPSDRVKAQFGARVHLALLSAAVEAFREAYQDLPTNRSAMSQRPDWATVWPEGGFLPSGKLPLDPWGKEYRIVTEEAGVTVMVREAKDHLLKTKDLTADELKSLAAGESPRLSTTELEQVEKLVKNLGDEDLQVREDAGTALLRCGPRISRILADRLTGEKDPQVAGDLRAILKRLAPSKQSGWKREFGSLSIRIGSNTKEEESTAFAGSGERMASAYLKTLPTAEADFRANDRDNNQQNDYWVRDIAGLYGMVPAGAEAKPANCIKVIESSLAKADATPERGHYPDGLQEEGAEPTPKNGYLFRMLAKDETGAAYDDGTGHSFGKFGVAAYPADYGVEGQRTFIVNEDATIWSKDLGGETIDQFPADPAAEGWTKLD